MLLANLYAGTESSERRYETGDDGMCTIQCVVRFPSIERSNIHSLITSTPTAVFEWTMTQHNIALVIVL